MKKIFLASESEVLNKLVPTILSDFEVIIPEKSDTEIFPLPSAEDDITLMIADGEKYYLKMREVFASNDMPVLILIPEHAERIDLADDKNAHVIRLPFILFHFISTVKYMVDPSVLKERSLEPIPVLKPFINPIASESAARNNAAVEMQADEIDAQNAENTQLEEKDNPSSDEQSEQNSESESLVKEDSSAETENALLQEDRTQETEENTENADNMDSLQNAETETGESSEIQAAEDNSLNGEAFSGAVATDNYSEDDSPAEPEKADDSENSASEEQNEKNSD